MTPLTGSGIPAALIEAFNGRYRDDESARMTGGFGSKAPACRSLEEKAGLTHRREAAAMFGTGAKPSQGFEV